MIEKNEEYEKHVADSEFYLLEILNNIDKIIYRGQTTNELDNFNEKTQKTISKAYDFYANVNIHGIIMNIMVYAIIFIFIYLLISLYFTKKIDLIMFVTFFSIIILYRDKMAIIFQQISDFIEFMGRTNVVLNHFKNMENKELNKKKLVKLAFDKIVFQNVTFKYKTSEKYLFKNFNMTLNTNNKIIGITGLSGKGKSTFAKLLIKLYQYEGDILIDDQNIKNIDADYIRQNIIYVNQSGKLFDKLVIDNILYGCEKTETCEKQIKMIMENYPKINELYKNVDLYRKKSGSLGENLSGGQRQVINIIGGLINPSKILILDEPTNALDIELKRDILDLISYYRKHKKCIIIITHDKDVYHLFNEKITI
jgi:ABC-type multidrug transport system fused ATPase/permease subunit